MDRETKNALNRYVASLEATGQLGLLGAYVTLPLRPGQSYRIWREIGGRKRRVGGDYDSYVEALETAASHNELMAKMVAR